MFTAFKAYNTIMFITTIKRIMDIAKLLEERHHVDISKNEPAIRSIQGMVFMSRMSDDEIVKGIMEMYFVSSKAN